MGTYQSHILQIPHSLRHMEFDGRLHPQVFEISSRDLEQFQNLRILKLTGFAKLKKLSENLGDLVNGLHELTLSYCKSIEELPSSISKLQLLRVLRMDYCSSLRKVPEGLGSLNSLQELNFQGCTNLRVLPTSLGKLFSLKILDLSSCKELVELPRGIENLTSLVNLSFHNCASLRSIPESIGRLKSSHSQWTCHVAQV
jgi:Leucine-rich repeat (LRR) protein